MLFLQPQFRTDTSEILNVITNDGKVLGYLLYVYERESDIYVMGHLQDVGEKNNFQELLKQYISGLKSACGVQEEPFTHIICGGEEIDLGKEEEQGSQS